MDSDVSYAAMGGLGGCPVPPRYHGAGLEQAFLILLRSVNFILHVMAHKQGGSRSRSGSLEQAS